MNYIKPLDTLRAIAVMLVIAWHWLGQDFWLNKFQNGPMGVVIFFVLSGFLITRILLEGRNKVEQVNGSKSVFFKNFYIRRSLRIFPLYYLVVGVFFIYSLAHNEYLNKYLYFFTYTSNYYFIKIQDWDMYLSHLWTLAIEEQFYLIWPLLILRVHKKFLLPLILSFIAVGIVSQLAANEGWGQFSTICCFDSLGWGALLAWVTVYKPKYLPKVYKVAGLVSVFIVPLVVYEVCKLQHMVIPFRIQASVVAFFIVSYIVYTCYNEVKLPRVLHFILHNNVLAAIGKISYGIYVYHIFVPYIWSISFFQKIYNYLPLIMRQQRIAVLSINFIILLGVCFLSWTFIEKPLLRLKKSFEIKEDAKVQTHLLAT